MAARCVDRALPKWVGGNFFYRREAKPEGKKNAGEEASQISHQFAESDDEKRKSHLGKGNFEMRNSGIGNCRV